MRRVRVLLEAGLVGEAVEMLGRHLAAHPGDPAALRSMAYALSALDRHEEAVGTAGQLVAAEPEDPEAHVTVAEVASAAGEAELAHRAASFALELAPADWSKLVLYTRVRCVHSDELWDGVALTVERIKNVELAERAVGLAPHEADAHVVLGLAYLHNGQARRADQAYAHALALDPVNHEATVGRTVCANRLAKPGKGVRASSALLANDPTDRVNQFLLLNSTVAALGLAMAVGVVMSLVAVRAAKAGFPGFDGAIAPNLLVGACALVSWLWVGFYLRRFRGAAARRVWALVKQSKLLLAYCWTGLAAQACLGAAALLPYRPLSASPSAMVAFMVLIQWPTWMAWWSLYFAAVFKLRREAKTL
ncbi:MAG: tetratricopeptide repeat protein [Bifidobacteriaceae bacterium]|jgi:hypothetical protein|nr:tetratricopeptide repeat protein [Bifidobacteriaceae bacterium]